MKKPIRYIIYCRFSPRPDAENSESLAWQEEICRAHVAKNGGVVIAVYSDADTSGAAGEVGAEEERPGLWEAMDSLEPGVVLLVYKMDRFVRGVYLSEQLFREIRSKKAKFEAVVGGEMVDSPEGNMIRVILAAVDECARTSGNARTRLSMLRHQKDNRAMGSIPPYGKRRAPDAMVMKDGALTAQRRWEDDPVEMPIVEEIIRLATVEGMRPQQIANRMREIGAPCRDKKIGWNHKVISRICRRAHVERAYVKA